MSKITQIKQDNTTRRVHVYIDYHLCTSIRESIWKEMSLIEGSEVSCAELRKKEALICKQSNKINTIFDLKQAVSRTVLWLDQYLPNLKAKVVDFKFDYDNSGLSLNYPKTRSDQNISLLLRGTNVEVIALEVATTEIQRGINYWVRSDKIAYAQSQSKRDVWVILYYRHPKEQFTWIKPESGKEYKHEELIGNTKSYFVPFNDRSSEVHSSQSFCDYIQKKIDNMVSDIKPKILNCGLPDKTADLDKK